MRPSPVLPALIALAGCGAYDIAIDGLGVTSGGSQDIGYARALIEDGMVPTGSQFTAEGLFSEHDLPLPGGPCDAVLCPRASVSLHQPPDDDARMLVQLGFASNISRATFERPTLDLALLVDTSGSMSGGPLDDTKAALHAIVAQLGPNDLVSLTEFGSKAKVLMRPSAMNASGKSTLRDAIDALSTNGSTDMESGMRKAFGQIDAANGRSGRLMIFSDAQPNTGLTETSDFVSLVRREAERQVGTTFVGAGLLGADLVTTLSKVRGGNAVYLSEDTLEPQFTDDFAFLVTPIAYDLNATLSTADAAMTTSAVYGAPVDDGQVAIGASTLFLSRNGGGIGVLLSEALVEAGQIGAFDLSYTLPGSAGTVSDSVDIQWGGGHFRDGADSIGVYKMGVLIEQIDAMRSAAVACQDPAVAADAQTLVLRTAERLQEHADAIDDEALAREANLMTKLAENLGYETISCANGAW